jgi:hypothetical protein
MMKNIFIVVIALISFSNISFSQASIKKLYEAKFDDYVGRLDLNIHSNDIIAYSLYISNNKDTTTFRQKGTVIFPLYGFETPSLWGYEEEIRLKNDSIIYARQFVELCKCNEWVSLKLPKDFSVAMLVITNELAAKIFGKKSSSFLGKPPALFYLKN